MPHLRYQTPDRLVGAADFSDDLRGSLNAVKLVKSQKWVWDSLRESCDLASNYARKREPGDWSLACVAFIASKHVDIRPWWDEASLELWEACGFQARPSYMRTWRRLRELETVCDEFLHAAALVIQRCKWHDSRVMAHVHFDFTECESHAALIHDCGPDDECPYRKATKGGRRAWGYAKRPERASTETVRAERHSLAEDDPETAEEREKTSTPEQTEAQHNGKRIRLGGCWYRLRDPDAGVRAYTGLRSRRKCWTGYYGGKAIDHFSGGVIPSVDSASIQECTLFNSLFDRVSEMAGGAPETAIADRGMSISSCFEHATTHGTAPIFPWRRTSKDGKRHDHETYDRHGVKRCRACGGDMEQVRFSANEGSPRLWFRCSLPATPACEKEQTISCGEDWRTLLPLSRTSPLYQELRASHRSYEGAHRYFRDRYNVAGDSLANRPKVVSINFHRLRANAACLLDWLKIAAKNGWLGTVRAKKRHPGTREFQDGGEEAAVNLADTRARLGLCSAYGPAAKALGLGDALPPSERKHPWVPPPLPASP